jgi:hypothetical protein
MMRSCSTETSRSTLSGDIGAHVSQRLIAAYAADNHSDRPIFRWMRRFGVTPRMKIAVRKTATPTRT